MIFPTATTLAANTDSKRSLCPDVHKGIEFYKRSTWKWQDKLGVEKTKASKARIPRTACKYAKYVAKIWIHRSHKLRARYIEHQREWDWQNKLPQWAKDLARCESSYNWWAEGSSQDGVFYSAFNISRSQYDKDAHYMGVRGWYEGPGVPSPVEQTWAVIGHMRLLGDGFTGRCHGIAQSSW